MAERKVRHATIQYFVHDSQGNVTSFETAFRNQVVDIPADQVERLDSLGATVPVDQDLARPGRMLTLPDTAGDAEILSWVMGASSAEVEVLVAERPAMAGRILAAKESVTARFKEQDEHLGGGGLKKIADESAAEAEAAAAAEAKAVEEAAEAEAERAAAQAQAEADLIGGALTAEQADEIVKGKATDVTDYLSENPVNASAVLEAEGRLAEKEKRDPRVSIVKSAEAAAGFTAQ